MHIRFFSYSKQFIQPYFPSIKNKAGFTHPYFPSIKNRDGFTLIELLVVMFVIGLLATTIVIKVDGIRQQARDVRRVVDLIQLSNALELYYSDNNKYPPTCFGVGPGKEANQEGCPNNYIKGLSNYIPRLPIDPNPEVEFGYTYYVSGDADNQQHYKLFALKSVEEDVVAGDPFARCAISCDEAGDCSSDNILHTYSVYTPGYDKSLDKLVECF